MLTLIRSSNGNVPRESRAKITAIVVAALFVVPLPSWAAEHDVECPPLLTPEVLQVSGLPSGFTAYIPFGLRLNAAGAMDGPPSLMGILQEDPKSSQKKTTWSFKGGKDIYPDGKWMACYYGGGNEIVISRRINDSTSECTVNYATTKLGIKDIKVRCTW